MREAAVIVAIACLIVPGVVAQERTPAELEELAADANSQGNVTYGPPQPLPDQGEPEATIYFSDFEADDGGLSGTLDWEWGEYTGAVCDSSEPPPAAYSGTHMWGTVLLGCYSNAGNNQSSCPGGNSDIRDDSILSLSLDLTGYVNATMTWWEWDDFFTPWDYAQVYVNGVMVDENCSETPGAWEQKSVDLTPYVGLPVSIEFHFMASTVVDDAGWYIDDLEITGDPIPVELMTLTVE